MNEQKTVFAHLNARQEIDFNNQEFQALFFLIQAFDSYLSSNKKSIQEKAVVFFDRNVYGRKDTEAYDFENSQPIKRMVFVQKKKIDLLALPDFFGFMFRKSKLYHNQKDLVLNPAETRLISHCHNALTAITKAGLFRFLNLDNWLKERA
jgi:hypothetical protein